MNDTMNQFKRPAIVQVLPALVTGGAERGAIDVAVASLEAGLQSIVISSGGPMARELSRAGATHIELPVDSKNPVTVKRNIRRIQDAIREHTGNTGSDVVPGIVHARSRAPAWSALHAAKALGMAFVTTFHATYNYNSPVKKAYNAVMIKGERVIAISNFIRDHMMNDYQCEWARIRVIHRGIDTGMFHPEKVSVERVVKLATDWRLPDGVPVVMLPGRLTRWKGQILLLRALAKIKDRPYRCLLVGSDQGRTAYREELEREAESLGIADRVHIVDDCRDMPAAYMLADVVVSASTDPEAFGRVAVEGQAMGRPVVAPNHGAAPEQVTHGVTGFLFDPSNEDSLASMLDQALALGPEERERLRDVGIANVAEHFTKEVMCGKTLDVYREILDRHHFT